MKLQDLARNWDGFGRSDPLWAIRTARDKRGNKWPLEEFFETGVREIARVIQHIESLITDDQAAGAGWVSFRYCAVKA